MSDAKMEAQIEQQDLKIKALTNQLDNLSREVDEFLGVLDINLHQLAHYAEQKENFTEENWNELHKQRKQLEDKLHRELENIRNPVKTKRSYDNLHVQRHWLFVK